MGKTKDLTGMQFGELRVLGESSIKSYNKKWRCLCSCGSIKDITGVNLKSGNTKGCGCQRRKKGAEHHNSTHGLAGTKTYNTYRHMMARCYYKKQKGYKNYGGREIKVCKRWRESFVNFVGDMGLKPPNMSIERINNDGDYKPENCKWASYQEQAFNKRKGKNKSSKYIGVHKIKSNGKWQSCIGWNHKLYNLGSFKDEYEAHQTYERAKKRLLNFKKRNTPVKEK